MAEKILKARQVMAAGEGDHKDGAGLFLRVKRGSAFWVFRYTAPSGKRREMGLGPAMRSSLEDAGANMTAARDALLAARGLLTRGIDPLDERERRSQEAAAAQEVVKARRKAVQLTLARAARDYHERVIEPRLSTKHAAQWIASLENHVAAQVWHKPIAQITAPELLQALAGVRSLEVKGERVPETLRRIRQRLDAVFEDAIFHGHCTHNPAAAIRRKMRETMPAAKPGQFRALPFAEVPRLAAQLRQAQGVAARCLEFALLTAARTSEALEAEWCEFDLEAGTWKVPAAKMKGGEEHLVFLSPAARAVVAGQIGLDRRYLFPSVMREGRPLSNMALLATLGRLGMRQATTVHGLCRASFSTWAYETAAARPEVIEACLAHKEADKVKAAYNRAEFNAERRALLCAWAEFVSKPGAVVVPLRAA